MQVSRVTTLRHWLIAFLAMVLIGCQSLHPTPLVTPTWGGGEATVQSVSDRSVRGRVEFGSRATQATPGVVVNAATVSFIDTGTNQTVATGKTDAAGSFNLSLGGFSPVDGATYLLEAVKGLNNQAPGSDSARFRTVLKWDGTGWLSCTNAAVGGSIVINALTTALSIETALDPVNVAAADTIGKVDVSINPAALNAAPTYTHHPDSEINQLATDLLSYLGADTDPVASVPAIAPSVVSFTPTSGAGNSLVKIQGSGFSPVPSGNTVTFNGATAQVLLATPTSLVVVVPSGATTGPVRVQTGRGLATGATFSVVAGAGTLSISGFAPSSGHAGDSVTLSGEFGSATGSVTLGSVRAKVTNWTSSTVTVTVPFGAANGTWTVQSGSATATSAQLFALYMGELGAFKYAYDRHAFPYTTLYGEMPVVIGNYVYFFGGNGNGAAQSDVFRAPLRSDGSMGAFQRVGSMTAAMWYATPIRIGDWLYLVGGYTGGPSHTTVQRAAINPDGTLGSFNNYSNLLTPRCGTALAIMNGYLFVLGGHNGVPIAAIERAAINPDGSLGAFQNAGNLPEARAWPTCFTSGSRIYLMGGNNGTSHVANIRIVPVNPDGSFGAITFNPTNMTTARYAAGGFMYNGAIYNVGGNDGTSYLSSVERCTVNGDGTLSAGTLLSSMNTARYVATPVVSGNRVYVWGGTNIGGGLQNMEVAELNTDGTLQPFRAVGSSFPTEGMGIALFGDKLYKIGGRSTTDTTLVEQATVFSDGIISPFRKVRDLTVPRGYTNVVRVGSFLYVIGGRNGGSILRSVERAYIDPVDNTIGDFAPVAQSLVFPRYAANSKVIGNYLYVTGGYTGSQGYDTIERAIINPDGSIGDFEVYQGSKLLVARACHGFVAIGDYCYVIGGYVGGSYVSTVEQARISPDGSIGPFVVDSDLPIISYGHSSDGYAVLGNFLYIFGGYNNVSADNRVMRAPIAPDGDLGTWQIFGGLINQGRYHHSVVASGSYVYLLGGYRDGIAEGRVEVAKWR